MAARSLTTASGDGPDYDDPAGRLEIILPDPCLVILCGPSGAGKSTFAQEHFRATQIVSSDRCRALISDTEAFGPESSGRAFALLYETIRHRLALRKLTVADTTALERSSRAKFIDLAREFAIPAVLILLAIQEEECFERNTRRHRDVGRRVIARQHRLLRTTLLSIASEPFAAAHIVTDDMLSRLTVRPASEPPAAGAAATGATGAAGAVGEVSSTLSPVASSVQAPRSIAFEGWIDPWAAPAVEIGSAEWRAVCRETIETAGAVPPARRRAALQILTAADFDPRWIVLPPPPGPAPPPPDWAAAIRGDATDAHLDRNRGPGRVSTSDRKEPVAAGDENPVEVFGRLCRFLRRRGYRRVCLEARPARAEPVTIVVTREPYHALRRLGVEGWGAVVPASGRALFDPATSARWLEEIARDLDNAALFTRSRSPILVAQGLAVWGRSTREGSSPVPIVSAPRTDTPWLPLGARTPPPTPPPEDPETALDPAYFPAAQASDGAGANSRAREFATPFRPRNAEPSRLRLWLTDVLLPAEPTDPAHPDYIWWVAETSDLAEAFGRAPRLVLDLDKNDPWDDLETLWWWVGWWRRPGWDVVVSRASRREGRMETAGANGIPSDEAADIGPRRPAVRISPGGDAGAMDRSGGSDRSDGSGGSGGRGLDRVDGVARVDGAGGADEASETAHRRWLCREKAASRLAAGLGDRLWRPWVVAGYALTPSVETPPQGDFFAVDGGA